MPEKFNPLNSMEGEGKNYPAPQEDIDVLHEEALFLNSKRISEMYEEREDDETKENLVLTEKIAESVEREGGRALIVGGFARDITMSRLGYSFDSKDIDVEVYGIDSEKLKELLEDAGEVNTVGESYKVFKIGGLDVSIPRRDSKTGEGHKGFTVEGDPDMSFAEAARRRDLTINALALNPLTGQIIDEHGGLEDIKQKRLRAVDLDTFAEDPLRVLRVMQFAGRFGFDVEEQTAELCRSLDLKDLSDERIGEEWRKLLLKSPKPSIGFEAGRKIGVIEKLHPELQALIGAEQNPEHHPEGDVWNHTLMACDVAAEIIRREDMPEEEAQVLVYAALCHDLGKPDAEEIKDGKITHHGHEETGIEPARSLLNNILKGQENRRHIIEKVLPLVKDHMFFNNNDVEDISDAALRRLAKRLHPANINELTLLKEADNRGRIEVEEYSPDVRDKILERASKLKIENQKSQRIITGKDLLELGVKPGPQMGEYLNKLEEAQLDGKFSTKDEGLEYFKNVLD